MPEPVSPTQAREQLDRWFRSGLFGILLLLVLVGTVRSYFALEYAIVTWFEPRWVPVVQAAFGLAVVALAAWLIRAFVIAKAR